MCEDLRSFGYILGTVLIPLVLTSIQSLFTRWNLRRTCTSSSLNANNLLCTWAFFGLTNFEFNGLAIAQRCISTAGLNVGMMNKQILTTGFRSNKSEALVCAKPLYCTFSRAIYSSLFW